MNYSRINLVVKETIVEDGKVLHVMKRTKNLHIEAGSLIGPDGKEYKYRVNEERYHYISKNKYKVDYIIKFDDQSLRFHKGTKFKKAVEHWRQFIPDSRLLEIEYYEILIDLSEPEEENDGYSLTVDLNGNVSLKKFRPHQQDQSENFLVESEKIEMLFDQILSCVDSKDSYNEFWYDDTIRIIKLHFENKEVLEFNQVFCNKKLCSANVIYSFLNDCGKLNFALT